MINYRLISAHFAAVLVGSMAIMVGIGALRGGPEGALAGLLGWFGGFAIMSVLAFATIPLGLGLRWLVGHIPFRPIPIACGSGVVVGLALIPVLHPSMSLNVSAAMHPMQLVLIHAIAGLAGGLAWSVVEKPARKDCT